MIFSCYFLPYCKDGHGLSQEKRQLCSITTTIAKYIHILLAMSWGTEINATCMRTDQDLQPSNAMYTEYVDWEQHSFSGIGLPLQLGVS